MESQHMNRFIIRVYGLIINTSAQVLLSDEYVHQMKMTKFPGGGLEFGEGPEDCIKREALEEFGQEIEITEHFYTTGFFQPALFFDNQQLISIYYLIKLKEPPRFPVASKPFNFREGINGNQSFRWASLSDLTEQDMTFPIDRYVLTLLKKKG
jgi:8-oxo-dGTP diphosphatase